MNKEERNSFRKEMIGKLEEQWAKSHSPEDDPSITTHLKIKLSGVPA